MKFLLVLIFLLWAPRKHLTNVTSGIEMSYVLLKNMNASCYPMDTCDTGRSQDSPGISINYSCSCDRLCSKLGTCCIDSPYRGTTSPKLKPKCRAVEETSSPRGYYMVDKCSNSVGVNSFWEHLCEDEWNEEDNIMLLAPVTSLFTSMTYKNYYCFRCHEKTYEFLYWNLELQSHYNDSGVILQNQDLNLMYDRDNRTWIATLEDGNIFIPVKFAFDIPDNVKPLAAQCEPGVISRCSNKWVDETIRDKCNAYTAIMHVRVGGSLLKYKNAHCALCNFESLDSMTCRHVEVTVLADKTHFSFIYLLDINRSNGEKVGKVKKCEDNFLWDPYTQKCRKITCSLPEYIVKDGKCSPP